MMQTNVVEKIKTHILFQ